MHFVDQHREKIRQSPMSSRLLWACLLLVVLLPGLLAYVFGRLAFGSRVSGVYFSIMSQAMTYALMLAFFRNEMGFGGNNGLTDFKSLLGFELQTDGMRTVLFACSALALMAGYCLCRAVTASRLGRVCVAVRDAESRVRFIGYRVERYQVAVFTLSAILARTEWGVTDEAVLSAIACHTAGKAGMTQLDKILYLADMTSAERDWPGVEKLRKLEKKNLDAAMLAALKQTNDFVLSQGKPLDPMSKAAYEDILARSGKNER